MLRHLCLAFSFLVAGAVTVFPQQLTPKLMLPIGSRLELLSARFSPDGKRILTASADKTAMLWDLAAGNLIIVLDGHKDKLASAEFSPDGKKIVTASYDNMVKLWDAGTGALLFTFEGHKDVVFSARFSSDNRKIISASADGTAKLWDAVTRRLILTLPEPAAKANVAEFSPDGTMAVIAFADGKAGILNIKKNEFNYLVDRSADGVSPDKKNRAHTASVITAQFSNDNNYVVTASEDRTAKIWDIKNGSLKKVLAKHKDRLYSARFSPDGSKVVTASKDRVAMIWNIADENVLQLTGHGASVLSAQFTLDGKKIITTSFDTTARIWDAESGHPDAVLRGHGRTVFSAALSSDSTRLVTASYDGTAKIWDIESRNLIITLAGHTNWVYSAMYSADGKKIVTATDDKAIKVWDAVTGSLLANLKGHKDWVYFAMFSPDGRKIVSTSRDKTIKIWDVATGEEDLNFRAKDMRQFSDYSPDGSKIVFATGNNSIQIIDTLTWDTVSSSIRHSQMRIAKFSSDGQRIITASGDSTARVWDLATSNLLHTLKGHDDAVLFAAYSPDNRTIVTTSSDQTAILWDSSGIARDTLIGHADKVTYASFSSDSKKLVTASEDETARIWDVKTGDLLTILKGHTDWVNTAQFDAEGKKVITASGDNTVKVWNADNGNLLYTFFAVDSTDYLVVDANNHFDGSENARNMLYFTCGSEVVSLDQVKDELWVPNLAEELNAGRVVKSKTLSQLDVCGLIPEVTSIEGDPGKFSFTITARRGGLGDVVLFVNGIEARRYNKTQLDSLPGNYAVSIAKDSLTGYFIAGEENSVTLKAYTGDNLISSPEAKINIEKDSSTVTSNLYAVMVGTSTYKENSNSAERLFDTNISLNYPAIDARTVSQTLAVAARKMLNTDGKEHVFMYNLTTDSADVLKPNKKNIKLVLDSIGKMATANDILLIFLSGHGVMDESGDRKRFYYMTADASSLLDEKAYPVVGISTDTLAEWIRPKNIRAQKRILILDACHSGQAINDLLVSNVQQSNAALETGDRSHMIKDMDRLNEKSGLFVLSASASTKSAFESDKYAHGYLTYSLLKAIKRQPDILEDGKNLNISRWFNAAGKTVKEIAREENNDQKTQIFSVTDFNIGEVDSLVKSNIKLKGEKPIFTGSVFQTADSVFDSIAGRDPLGLSKAVNDLLQETAVKEKKIVFSQNAGGHDEYMVTGSYVQSDGKLILRFVIKKGDIAVCNFEETGAAGKENLKELTGRILIKVMDCLEQK